MKNGIVYIVFKNINKKIKNLGENYYFKELEHSVKSIRKIHPNLSITLFTDSNIKVNGINNIEFITVKNSRIKQDYLLKSPYDNTLYLDSDTCIVESIVSLFKLMERFDIAATVDHIRKNNKVSSVWSTYNNIPDGFPEYAGGVILFKKCKKVYEFFNIWHNRYNEWCKLSGKINDQPSFRVALYMTKGLYIHTLPPEYNIRSKKYNNVIPKIYHNHSLWKENTKNNYGNIWI